MYLIIMKYLLITLIFAVLFYSCTQINNAPQSETPLSSIRYNFNLDSSSYDSGWSQYEDTLIIVDDTVDLFDTVPLAGFDSTLFATWSVYEDSLVITSVPLAKIDTFFLKQHIEELFIYGADEPVSTVIWDTVARAYTQMGFVYSYIVGGDTLTYVERFPESVVSSSSSPEVSGTPSSTLSSVEESSSSSSSSFSIESSLESEPAESSLNDSADSDSSTLSSSSLVNSSAVSSTAESSASVDNRYVVIKPIIETYKDSLDDKGANYTLYMLMYYNQIDGDLGIDLDKIVLRYKETFLDDVRGVYFDSLSIDSGVSYNETTKEMQLFPGDSAHVRMYYEVDTTKTVIRVSYLTYDDNIFAILDSTGYAEYLLTLTE